MTSYDDVDAICPFFRSSEKRKIVCEGIHDRCNTHLVFLTGADRNLHRRVFCDKKFQNCEVYQMLERQYVD